MSSFYDDSASPSPASSSFSLPPLPSPIAPPPSSSAPASFVFDGDQSTLRASASSALVLEAYLHYTHLASASCGHKAMKPRKVAVGESFFQSMMEVEDDDEEDSTANEDDAAAFLSELFLQYSLLALQDAVAEAEALAQEEEAFWTAFDKTVEAVVREGEKERFHATSAAAARKKAPLRKATMKMEVEDEAPALSSSFWSSISSVNTEPSNSLSRSSTLSSVSSLGSTTTTISTSSSSFSSSSSPSFAPIPSSGAVPHKHSASALRPLHTWLLEHIPSSYIPSCSSSSSVDLVFPSTSSSTTLALSRASGLKPAQITTFFENYRYVSLPPPSPPPFPLLLSFIFAFPFTFLLISFPSFPPSLPPSLSLDTSTSPPYWQGHGNPPRSTKSF